MMNKIIVWTDILFLVIIAFMSIPVVSGGSQSLLSLQEFKTDDEFKEYLSNISTRYQSIPVDDTGLSDYNLIREEKTAVPVMGGMKETSQTSLIPSPQQGADAYSTTNIQVAGVDEADFVKYDGKYIYIINGNTLSIILAYPPRSASVLATESIPGTVSELFLSGDRLVVFSSEYGYSEQQMISTKYLPYHEVITHATVYDITDRSKPRKIRDISSPGRYEQARMIGNDIYVLTAENQGYYDPRLPVIYDDSREIKGGSVWCPPFIMNEYRMNTLTSFPVFSNGTPQAVSFLLGWDTTLYVSATDVFVAYQREDYGWIQPRMGQDLLIQGIYSLPDQESVIHRFAIDKGSIRYKSTGIVPGNLLNQFSLDQYEGNLRVATTIGGNQYNNVFILNPDMDIIGKLEHLAPGEKIYSARFLDDILYLVTFKQTDPLFVIDLSNPNQPGVLGELKIPGYSDYLHPYDRTHLIGIGKDTYENSGGGVIPAGIKIALFDVSDMNNPRMVDSRVIGDRGSESSVLTDHRAFLLDRERNTLAIPVKEVVRVPVTASRYGGSYTQEIWQGTYVFGIDSEKGFSEKGKVKQADNSPDDTYSSGSMVLRSLFMEQVLYTISPDRIIGSDLEDLSRRLMEIQLPESPENPWYFRPLWESLVK